MIDKRLRYDEPATGYGHPTFPDSVNRQISADHNIDGTHRTWVDVRSFGAVGNGTTDDTVAIQSALTYAATLPVITSLRNVALVVMPYGKYKVTSQLIVPSGVNLYCEGILYNNLVDAWQPALWFKAGSHCAKLQLWGNLGSGVKFGELGQSCNMQIGDVRLLNIGEEYDGIKGPKKGVHFQGYNFTFDSIDCDGGNIGVDIETASDIRGNKILSFSASTGVRITSASEHIYIQTMDIDTPSNIGLQFDTSHDVYLGNCGIFINDMQYSGALANAVIIGAYSGGDKVNDLQINLRVQNTGGQAVKVSNTRNSMVSMIATNASLATGNAHPITSALEFGAGVEATVMVDANIDGIASLITGTGGCVRYSEAGALKYRGSNGTITTLGAA